jgi:ferrous iron transport protein A
MENDMTKTYKMCDMRVGEYATVSEILPLCPIRRRLYDVGLIDGTHIQCLFQSAGRDMKAFLIRGAVIALRRTDCAHVLVSKEGERDEK